MTPNSASKPEGTHSYYRQPRSHGYEASRTEAYSSSNCSTLIDYASNEAVTERWSAPTYAGSEAEADEPCFVLMDSNSPTGARPYQTYDTTPDTLPGNTSIGTATEPYSAYTLMEDDVESGEPEEPCGLSRSPDSEAPDVRRALSTSSSTIVNCYVHDPMIESWSGPTLSGSLFGENLADIYRETELDQARIPDATLTERKIGLIPLFLSVNDLALAGSVAQRPNRSSTHWRVVTKDANRQDGRSATRQLTNMESHKLSLADHRREISETVLYQRVSLSYHSFP
jgi:hypothetical protein